MVAFGFHTAVEVSILQSLSDEHLPKNLILLLEPGNLKNTVHFFPFFLFFPPVYFFIFDFLRLLVF